MSLGGQVWIVTGASRGIGAEVAREVAARGGRPVLAARRRAARDRAAAAHDVEPPGARAPAPGSEGGPCETPTSHREPDMRER